MASWGVNGCLRVLRIWVFSHPLPLCVPGDRACTSEASRLTESGHQGTTQHHVVHDIDPG